MFVEVVRLFMVVLFTAAGYWIGRDASAGAVTPGLAAMLGCLVGYVSGGLFGRLLERAVGVVERKVDRLPAAQVLAGFVGGCAGALVGATLGVPIVVLVPPQLSLPIAGILVWTGGYLGFRLAAKKSTELFHMVGLSTRPLVRARPFDGDDGYVVDTSAVMDGKLLPLVASGLFHDDLMVPRFVLDELQGLADSADAVRSRRAQRGLEMLDVVRRESSLRMYVLDDEVPEIASVDAKLVALAKRLQLRLLTTDANLVRVAEVQGVPTCNLRRLAAELGPDVNAGEALQVGLTKTGREPGQGVGFLDDGSMVVVNGGAPLVGRGPVALVATSVVPTTVGRIVFAHPADTAEVEPR
ncbi:MAG: PIN domain nuclease [Actinobacteria bacterium]|nr:PIN domain nuclease [Actinomycetota bacterium]